MYKQSRSAIYTVNGFISLVMFMFEVVALILCKEANNFCGPKIWVCMVVVCILSCLGIGSCFTNHDTIQDRDMKTIYYFFQIFSGMGTFICLLLINTDCLQVYQNEVKLLYVVWITEIALFFLRIIGVIIYTVVEVMEKNGEERTKLLTNRPDILCQVVNTAIHKAFQSNDSIEPGGEV